MDSQDQQVLATIQRWALAGFRFALVTVARTYGSAPRQPGAWMALREDGLIQGSVSGGCVEDDLVRRLKNGELNGNQPFSLSYGVTREEAEHFGLPCGGRMELVIEPEPDSLLLADLQHRIGAGQLVSRVVDLKSGSVKLAKARDDSHFSWDERLLTTLHGPQWRLLIIGAGQIARYLAHMAQPLDYQVTVCDPRPQHHQEWDVPGAVWTPGYPDDVVLRMQPDPRTAVVALTHDPKLDDLALLEALKTPAFYIGALGSEANNSKRRERLLRYFDLTEPQIEKLRGPVGLAIGSRTPPEIAIAILAEMTAVKRGKEIRIERPGDAVQQDQRARQCADTACHAA